MARQKWSKKRSLHVVNEHFETIFNATMAEKMLRAKFSYNNKNIAVIATHSLGVSPSSHVKNT